MTRVDLSEYLSAGAANAARERLEAETAERYYVVHEPWAGCFRVLSREQFDRWLAPPSNGFRQS